MSYIRKASISVQGGSSSLDVSTLRCRFDIDQSTLGQPNMCYLRVTNLAPSTVAPFLAKEYNTLTVSAGYQDGPYGQIFTGKITQAVSGRETQTDTLLTVVAHDGGQARTSAAVNKTLQPGSTPNDHFQAAFSAMSKFGVSQGYIGPDLSTPKYPRAVTLYGMAWEVLDKIANLKKATWSVQNGKLQLLAKQGQGSFIPGAVVKLNSQTGLVGMPAQEIGSIWARCLLNPNIVVGSQVQINQADINPLVQTPDPRTGEQLGGPFSTSNFEIPSIAADGIYTVFKIDISGDTRGLPWYQDLHMLVAGQKTTQSVENEASFPRT